MLNPEISPSISKKVTDKVQHIALANKESANLASELYRLNYLCNEIETLKLDWHSKIFPTRSKKLENLQERILNLLDLIERTSLSAQDAKYFRAQIGNDLYDFKRPWYLFPFTPWIRATRNAYYSKSVTQKVIAGLSISSAITLTVLLATTSFRIFALQGENSLAKEKYITLQKKLTLIQSKKREILNLKTSLNDQNALLQSALNPEGQFSSGKSNGIQNAVPAQNSPSPLIQQRVAGDTWKLREKLRNMYPALEKSYSQLLDSDQKTDAKKSLKGENTSTLQLNSLISELNVLLFKASNDLKSTSPKMSDIFLYIDNSTKPDEISNSIQKQDEIMDIISRRLSDNTAIFSSTGVQDSLTIILIVAAFGILGSITSIIIRVQSVETDPRFGAVQYINDKGVSDSKPTDDPLVPLLSGLFRPFVGAFSSIFIFALISSGIISTTLFSSGNSFYLFIAISFVSGFSERLFVGWVKKTEGMFDASSSLGVPSASRGDNAPDNQGSTDHDQEQKSRILNKLAERFQPAEIEEKLRAKMNDLSLEKLNKLDVDSEKFEKVADLQDWLDQQQSS